MKQIYQITTTNERIENSNYLSLLTPKQKGEEDEKQENNQTLSIYPL